MSDRIHLSFADVGDLERRHVADAMAGGWIACVGPDVDAFEAELADRVGVAHGVAVNSGTSALHLALLSRGVGPGDVVPTSTMTFAATANAIAYTGARPYFVDSDPVTGNIDPELLGEVMADLAAAGERIGAVVPVDLLGKAVDYTAIGELTARHGVPLLADAAESLGARHAGRAVGSLGDAAAISFNGNKIMTTTGGGMLLTDDGDLARRAKHLSTQARQPVAHYEHAEVGYNYRLSNVLAALGRAQLSRLDEMIARRREMRQLYVDLFADVDGVRILGRDGDHDDNTWLTAIVVDEATTGWAPGALADHLARLDIETRQLWKPMHLQPAFAGERARVTGHAERLFRQGLALPSGSSLSDDQRRRVTGAVRDFVADR